jgi:hypothetical protein
MTRSSEKGVVTESVREGSSGGVAPETEQGMRARAKKATRRKRRAQGGIPYGFIPEYPPGPG